VLPNSVSTWASTPPLHRSPPSSCPSTKSGDSKLAAPPASHSHGYYRQTARRCCASSAGVSARRSIRLLRTPPLVVPGRGLRLRGGAVALRSAAWRASGGHRESAWCLRSGARQAIGGGTSRGHCLGWVTVRRCPVMLAGYLILS
jgi:hypothetical protein